MFKVNCVTCKSMELYPLTVAADIVACLARLINDSFCHPIDFANRSVWQCRAFDGVEGHA